MKLRLRLRNMLGERSYLRTRTLFILCPSRYGGLDKLKAKLPADQSPDVATTNLALSKYG